MPSAERYTRRRLLASSAVIALGAVAGCSQSDTASTPTDTPPPETETETETPAEGVETVVSIPGDLVPENMAFDEDGNFYFGITAGQVQMLPPTRPARLG